jgi:hypothetical protein
MPAVDDGAGVVAGILRITDGQPVTNCFADHRNRRSCVNPADSRHAQDPAAGAALRWSPPVTLGSPREEIEKCSGNHW